MPPPPSIARYPNVPSTLPPDRRSCGPSRPFPAGPPSLMSGQSVFRPARLSSSCSLPFRPCSSHKNAPCLARSAARRRRFVLRRARLPLHDNGLRFRLRRRPLPPRQPADKVPAQAFSSGSPAAGCPRAAVFPRPKPGSSPSSRRLSVLPPHRRHRAFSAAPRHRNHDGKTAILSARSPRLFPEDAPPCAARRRLLPASVPLPRRPHAAPRPFSCFRRQDASFSRK